MLALKCTLHTCISSWSRSIDSLKSGRILVFKSPDETNIHAYKTNTMANEKLLFFIHIPPYKSQRSDELID